MSNCSFTLIHKILSLLPLVNIRPRGDNLVIETSRLVAFCIYRLVKYTVQIVLPLLSLPVTVLTHTILWPILIHCWTCQSAEIIPFTHFTHLGWYFLYLKTRPTPWLEFSSTPWFKLYSASWYIVSLTAWQKVRCGYLSYWVAWLYRVTIVLIVSVIRSYYWRWCIIDGYRCWYAANIMRKRCLWCRHPKRCTHMHLGRHWSHTTVQSSTLRIFSRSLLSSLILCGIS